ncbi:MAG TPA: NAD(+)/NADH kinase [Thermoanaerobaculia bacterium]|nr:NAD(+)/NADH kinase [Thermoanaerobaculia bacterium]
MRNIGIAAKTSSTAALEYAAGVARDLRKRGFSVYFDDVTAAAMGDRAGASVSRSGLGSECDLLITFGGDGTLLSVARHAPANVPILGVNMGTLGFLTEVRLEEFPPLLERVLQDDYIVEPRVTFIVSVTGRDRDEQQYRVLNDAAINKSALARIIEMRVTVAGLFVSTFRGDGLIICTPTGSTAYNLSAGGPIVYPTMNAMVITPICPHMISNRPLVLPDELDVEIGIVTPAEEQEIYVTLDGQEGMPINENDRVCIRKSTENILLVQSPDKNYFDVLRTKLKWGEDSTFR